MSPGQIKSSDPKHETGPEVNVLLDIGREVRQLRAQPFGLGLAKPDPVRQLHIQSASGLERQAVCGCARMLGCRKDAVEPIRFSKQSLPEARQSSPSHRPRIAWTEGRRNQGESGA
jgi:hypothetical protein